jgi:hypothetical protein
MNAMTTTIEADARAMTQAERVAYLRECGWYRLSASGSQTWLAPGCRRVNGVVEPPEHDRTFYSLAAAIREALSREAVDDDVSAMVREGLITPADARVIRRHREEQKTRDARAAEKAAEMEAERLRWLERQEEEKRMSPAWAEFVLAHSPGLGESVLQGTMQLREAVRKIEADTGCNVGCGRHRPLTPDEREQLITQMDQGVGDRGRLDREQAELVLDWAPYTVVQFREEAQAS